MPKSVFLVGEDQVCCALGIALIAYSDAAATIENSDCAGGFGPFKAKIEKMNAVAANVMPVLMIADGDQAPTAQAQVAAWLPRNVAQNFSLRLAVREAESWVLADHEGLSAFADVSRAILPATPDLIQDPKQALLQVIRRSSRRQLREEMLPGRKSTAPVGLGYNLHLVGFVREFWSVERAAARSPSLARALPRIAAILA